MYMTLLYSSEFCNVNFISFGTISDTLGARFDK
jgi:hypothetical protein